MNLRLNAHRLRLLIAVALLAVAILPALFSHADAAELPRSSGQAAYGTLSLIEPSQLVPAMQLTATVPLSAPTSAYLPLIYTAPPLSPFAEKSRDLINMNLDGMFQRPDNRLVSFDIEAARAAGYAEPSIILASELTSFTNDLIIASEQADANSTIVWTTYERASTYTNMMSFLQEANNPDNWLDEKEMEQFATSLKAPQSQISEVVCGTWMYPRPNGAPQWQHGIHSPNPTLDLLNMGYHPPPTWLKVIYWTRPITWEPFLCGIDSFRENGNIEGPQIIGLQTYAGWTPPGEPNPEVWRSGPWPYPHWPIYVLWWHGKF